MTQSFLLRHDARWEILMGLLLAGYARECAGCGPRNPRCIAQREIERCPSIYGRLGPNPTAIARNDSLHRRETDSRAFKFTFIVQPLERRKELACVGHVKSRAIVADV